MRLLLDTHALIWWDRDPDKLPRRVRRALQAGANELLLSIASIWEMQIKQQKGTLRLDRPVRATIESQQEQNGVQVVGLTLPHVWQLAELPLHHGDPFDRILISQAKAEGLTLVSRDRIMRKYGVEILW